MDGYKTSAIVASEVESRAQHTPTAIFLIVEGDTDIRLFARHFDREGVRLIHAESKANARGAVLQLNADAPKLAVLAIVDADFERLEGERHQRPTSSGPMVTTPR